MSIMFSVELLQRIAMSSVSATGITLYMLLALTCDHFVVHSSASDRLNESLLASQHYNRILKFAKCQVSFINVHLHKFNSFKF